MLHVRFNIDKSFELDSLSNFCDNSKHLSPTLECYFFMDDNVLVFISNSSSFEFSYELINRVIKELDKLTVDSEVLSLILN